MAALIYLLGVVDNIQLSLALLAFFSGLASLVMVIAAIVVASEEKDNIYRRVDNEGVDQRKQKKIKAAKKLALICSLPAFVLANIIPDSKTIAAMYLVPKIAQNESVAQLPEKALNILDMKLDLWTKQLIKDDLKKNEPDQKK